ncbi:MoxR-like ATPase [Rhizobium mongolense subsp. loessense]|uniref:MoxR-like ATPase n=1 Tax=Rhizobium mongolense subsp. loessense TaxID=158890 RepID=A0A1G4RAH3_9HYPH|nr:MoxR family ATPase [Rhizobium mongolense]SCW53776.1 MoxR-like ATPase [Rhizobium mongolense subsp. loessense]
MGMMKTEDSLGEKEIIAAAEKALADIALVREEVSKVIFGQESVVENTLLAVLSGGHALLVGVPGLAKTKLVTTLGEVLGLGANRIQFTPDLMPSDILGSEVMDQDENGRRSFRFVKGPVFAQLLMADEINRASPRTQSALLQSMQEYHVTIAGQRYDLPTPFHVLATQNPLEQEGTYPLPEAQLDRFLLQVDVHYPELAAERQILLETTGISETKPQAVLDAGRLMEIQKLIRQMPVSDKVVDAILDLVRSARPGEGNAATDKNVAWGPGPRAGQAMMLCARARALYEGRLAPSLDDIHALAEPVLEHRMALTFAARAEGMSVRDVIAGLVKQAKG